MIEMRLAQNKDIPRLKEIWKRCFGDPESYIDFYFAHRFQAEATAVLQVKEEIAAMLTMIPVQWVTPDHKIYDAAMLYAIATHPEYRKKGLASQLINDSHQVLRERNQKFSVLVPAEKGLFTFYNRLGYEEGFYIREKVFSRDEIARLPVEPSYQCSVAPVSAQAYNERRNLYLNGKSYTAYSLEDIEYQKKVSQWSGADLYALDILYDEGHSALQGCAVIERISPEQVIVKELLWQNQFINSAIRQIAQHLPAKEWIVRMPAFFGEHLGGTVRPFGMVRAVGTTEPQGISKNLSYLGIAFD